MAHAHTWLPGCLQSCPFANMPTGCAVYLVKIWQQIYNLHYSGQDFPAEIASCVKAKIVYLPILTPPEGLALNMAV